MKRQDGRRSGETMWRYNSMAVTTIRTAVFGVVTRRASATLIGFGSASAGHVGHLSITAAQGQ
jgi:hypothetical protein